MNSGVSSSLGQCIQYSSCYHINDGGALHIKPVSSDSESEVLITLGTWHVRAFPLNSYSWSLSTPPQIMMVAQHEHALSSPMYAALQAWGEQMLISTDPTCLDEKKGGPNYVIPKLY
jgi:hypothetical protein